MLLASACSRLPSVPTAYSSLPPVAPAHELARTVTSPTAPSLAETAVPEAALPAIRIPGAGLGHGVATGGGQGVNPTDVLEASARARLSWTVMRPAELTRPLFMDRALVRSSVAETGALAADRPAARAAAPTYNREVVMDRLEQDGRRAAKPICSGC